MDDRLFDEVVAALAATRSRRGVLKVLGGLAGTVLTSFGATRVGAAAAQPRSGGNSACAHFCHDVFPPGPARGRCTGEAAHGRGPCYECGPRAPAAHPPLCGTACCQEGQVCDANGQCVRSCIGLHQACSADTPCCDPYACLPNAEGKTFCFCPDGQEPCPDGSCRACVSGQICISEAKGSLPVPAAAAQAVALRGIGKEPWRLTAATGGTCCANVGTNGTCCTVGPDACSTDAECCTGHCVDGACTCRDTGAACTTSDECCAGSACDSGRCCGSTGATCAGDDGCCPGTVCTGGICQGGGCGGLCR